MLADLVGVTTEDGIELSGAYFETPSRVRQAAVDALLFFHGDGGHFYRGLYLRMGERMAERGLTFLAANRRGHDLVAGGVRGGPLAGYAFETVDESRADFGAWLALLEQRGHRRVVIGGHSGGAVRAVYAQATQRYADVAGVVAVSPGEYGHQTLVGLHGDDFSGPFRESEQNLAEGRPDAFLRPGVPFGAMWTARTYVDCFHRDNRNSVVTHARDTGCPTLFVFGSEECDGPQVLPVCNAARQGLVDAAYPNVEVNVIDGANHGYVDREVQLTETIFSWLTGLDQRA